jgi:hypothetical protein
MLQGSSSIPSELAAFKAKLALPAHVKPIIYRMLFVDDGGVRRARADETFLSPQVTFIVKQRLKTICAGIGWGFLGYPIFNMVIKFPNLFYVPRTVGTIILCLAWFLPGAIHIARRLHRYGSKGIGWALFGVFWGLAIPLGVFVGFLALVVPLIPRG